MNSPTPEEIREARTKAGLSRKAAAELVHQSVRSWEKNEIGERVMQPVVWDLFQYKLAELAAAAKPSKKSKAKKRRSKR